MFVAFGIQPAMRIRRIILCGLPLSAIFFHIILYNARFWVGNVIEHKICVLIFSKYFFSLNISHSEKKVDPVLVKYVLQIGRSLVLSQLIFH